MKKLALLFGALSLVSSVAYAKEVVPVVEEVVVVEEAPVTYAAAPALKVTNVGQFLEVDNTSGKQNIGEGVHFGTNVGLSYEDWTFGIMARKTWSMDTHSKNHAEKLDYDSKIKSAGHRIDLDAWRHFENFDLGARWRQESNKDRYYLRGAYNYGMLSGWADVIYTSMNGAGKDSWEVEIMPVVLTYNGFGIGYNADIVKTLGADKAKTEDDAKAVYDHQIRLYTPTYQVTDKLGLSAEYRYQFQETKKFKGEAPEWQENNRHIAILNAAYQVSDALSVSGYYEYDFNRYDGHSGAKDQHKNYYGEFCIGWDYKF